MTDETEPTPVPNPPQTQTPEVIDVDKSWDGTGSLDDHRQQEFAKIKQPGFGEKKAD